MTRISPQRLRVARYTDIHRVAQCLGLTATPRGNRQRFRCPICREPHTTLRSRSNLARCFRCKKSFNPIDLVLAARHTSFPEAVRYLESILRDSS